MFNELILSWNGIRPLKGKWTFWISIQESEWIKYAEWGKDQQRSFQTETSLIQCNQDIVTVKSGFADSFCIQVSGDEKEKIHRLTVALSRSDLFQIEIPERLPPVFLKKRKSFSQMRLNHPRYRDLCSPTSLANALQCLGVIIDPIDLAQSCYDQGFDIYGNWVLNIAEAYHRSRIPCYVRRLLNFKALHQLLLEGKPVITSIKGDLTGAPKPYQGGHLCCIIGYENEKVFVLDSAFQDEVLISYDLNEFLKAWGERRNLAYVFL